MRRDSHEQLMGDLESIRLLLSDDDLRVEPVTSSPRSAMTAANDDIPVQAEPAAETAGEMEPAAEHSDEPAASQAPPAADDAPSGRRSARSMIRALLGQQWSEQANDLLGTASASISAQALDWSPTDTEELTQALQVRIDNTIEVWLEDMLDSHIGGLRDRLLEALQDELSTGIESRMQVNARVRARNEALLDQLRDASGE